MVGSGFLSQDNFDMTSLPAKTILSTSPGRYWYYFLKNERGLFRPEVHRWVEDLYAEIDRQKVVKKLDSSHGDTDEIN